MRVLWTARRSNQSILKEISPGISLEGMMLKLKLQYFGHLMRRVDSLEKTLMLGGIGGRRRGGSMCLYSWFTLLHSRNLTQHCKVTISSVQFISVAPSYPTLCNPMNRSTPGLPPSPTPGVHLDSRPLSQ